MTSSDGDRVRDASVGSGITRYWSPRDASVPLNEGYLADLDAFGMRSPALRTIDQLSELQVVVLLGEWGLGKTTTLKGYEQRAQADAGVEVVWFDLGDYGSDSLLVTEIFADPRLERWRGGDGELRLLLDSLDECKAHIPNLAGLLASRLRHSPVERLRLMIVCRTADWPLSLEAELRDIFGEVVVYELLPLQRHDVRTIAGQAGVDGDGLLTAVEHSGVTALASRPLTLRLLLRRFQQSGGELPDSQAQLYEEGVAWLCDEPNLSWHDAGLAGRLAVAQRLAVAGRLAAITVFSAAPAFWTGPVSGEVPAGDVLMEACTGGTEGTGRDRVEVTRDAVREVLGTGLFSSRGGSRLGWTHQSYAEFLAAWHLARRQLPQLQLRTLFAVDADGTVAPQLRGVAAWLVALAPERAAFLIASPSALTMASVVQRLSTGARGCLGSRAGLFGPGVRCRSSGSRPGTRPSLERRVGDAGCAGGGRHPGWCSP